MEDSGLGRFSPRLLREVTFKYSKADLVAVALIAIVVSVWAMVADGTFSVRTLLACEAMFFAFYCVGSLVAACSWVSAGVLFDLPLRLLVGYGILNTALLALAWVSPLGMLANFCILVAMTACLLICVGSREQTPVNPASLWVVALSLVATTLWCQDSIDPIAEQGNLVVFKPWVDGFYHSVHVQIFAESHGASTIEDFRLAGVPARLYHYGVYIFPAFIKQASGMHSYAVFAGVLAPVGVLFTGLAAYAFFGSLWGPWPGLTACAALLLLPDGAQQGMQNPFMSYHWLTQISPSATYGLALLAVAWLFVVIGCTRGSRRQLVVGWAFAAIVVAYKLHYVIASALLLLLVPAIFYREVGAGRRALWAICACVFYVVALSVGQLVPGVPVIKFDGSSVGEVLHLVQSFALPGALRDTLAQHMGREAPWTSNLLFGIPYVLFSSLGAIVPVAALLMIRLYRRTPLLYVVFPLLLVVNFLAMFFGLALDFDSSTPDELSHRPVMIVYFFVASWTGGAIGLALASWQRLAPLLRPALSGMCAMLLAVPAFFGSGVQLMWVMPKISPVRLPASLVRVAEYMRARGDTSDIFQDSQFDRIYAVAALSERRPFVSHTLTLMPFRSDLIAKRSTAIDRLMALPQPKLVVATARAYGVRWFLVQRGNKVQWPPEIVDNPVIEAGPFVLYDFE